jgi:quinol monooxygenase YgiN
MPSSRYGRLGDHPEAIRKIHDEVTTATKEMALQAGDISHRVYLNPQDGRDFLGIDEWKSAEAVQARRSRRSLLIRRFRSSSPRYSKVSQRSRSGRGPAENEW